MAVLYLYYAPAKTQINKAGAGLRTDRRSTAYPGVATEPAGQAIARAGLGGGQAGTELLPLPPALHPCMEQGGSLL